MMVGRSLDSHSSLGMTRTFSFIIDTRFKTEDENASQTTFIAAQAATQCLLNLVYSG